MNQPNSDQASPSPNGGPLRDLWLPVGAAVLTGIVWLTGGLEPIDRSVGDVLLRLTNRAPVDVPIAAVIIDDTSIAAHGPLPWPRSLIAQVVAAAHQAGASAVALDLLLVEAAPDPLDDLELERALDRGRSVLAAALGPDGGWLLPLPGFGGAERAAHIHAEVGPDGVARTLAATKQASGLSLPALSLAMARTVRPEIAIEAGSLIRPDFRPAPDRVQQVSAAEFLRARDRRAWVDGRLVFIGITATGSADRLIVPTCPGPAPSPGVLIHASATASVLRGGLVRAVGPAWVLLGIALASLAPQLVRTRSGTFRPVTILVLVLAVACLAAAALELDHLMIPFSPMVLAVVVSAALREGTESSRARRDSGRLIQQLLQHLEPRADTAVPRSSIDRLAALQRLQGAVIGDNAARRALLDGMQDGVVMWDSAGRIVVANPAARRLWGDHPRREDLAAAAGAETHSDPITLERGSRELELTTTTVGDGGMALIRDVTAERELDRRRRDMQRLVSHELKTPLASIAGLGETLERYQLERDEQQRVASLIRAESTRLGSMVATFLDLERLGSGEWEEIDSSVDLAELVAERLEILDETARSRNQRIVRRLEAGGSVRVAPALLDRVVDNLVGNALKYSADGAAVEVAVRSEGGDSLLTVTDTGPGIPSDALPHIFERFFRVPGTGKGGSGLGLAVVHEVVTWHGGCIKVDSTVGQGTTFTVRLPGEG